MSTIRFDRDTYNAGEAATVTYTGAEARGLVEILSPSRKPYSFTPNVGSGSFEWAIPTDAENGEYVVNLYGGRGIKLAHDTATVSGGVSPVTGFTDTGEVTPKTIEVEPGTYDILFKLTGYDDKIVTGVVVSEGTTKTVSVTIISKVVAPAKAFITFKSVPTGAGIWVKKH